MPGLKTVKNGLNAGFLNRKVAENRAKKYILSQNKNEQHNVRSGFMSGHSKWSTIKHKSGRDKKRGDFHCLIKRSRWQRRAAAEIRSQPRLRQALCRSQVSRTCPRIILNGPIKRHGRTGRGETTRKSSMKDTARAWGGRWWNAHGQPEPDHRRCQIHVPAVARSVGTDGVCGLDVR